MCQLQPDDVVIYYEYYLLYMQQISNNGGSQWFCSSTCRDAHAHDTRKPLRSSPRKLKLCECGISSCKVLTPLEHVVFSNGNF